MSVKMSSRKRASSLCAHRFQLRRQLTVQASTAVLKKLAEYLCSLRPEAAADLGHCVQASYRNIGPRDEFDEQNLEVLGHLDDPRFAEQISAVLKIGGAS